MAGCDHTSDRGMDCPPIARSLRLERAATSAAITRNNYRKVLKTPTARTQRQARSS
jgi:hypothetical protein